jgi:HEAT repeat protein
VQFRADLHDMLGSLDSAACSGYLPLYLPTGADLARMARTVRMVGGVRRGQPAGGAGGDRESPGRDHGSPGDYGLRKRIYALPAEQGEREIAPLPWAEVAAGHHRLVVLADPGMGKSWLIRSETRRLAGAAARLLQSPFSRIEDALIPVPVRADVLAAAPGRDLAEVATRYLTDEGLLAGRSAGPMRDRIRAGGVVLLIDALDEVPRHAPGQDRPAPRKRLEDMLRQWVERCPAPARCVLTSRLAGYVGPPLPGAHEAELLPFTASDVRSAVLAWDLHGPAAARIMGLLGDPALAGMARNPLLLALLCSLAVDPGRSGPLPSGRAGIYEAVLWQFLSGAHRADHRSPAALLDPADREDLMQILAQVAFTFAASPAGWRDRMPHGDLDAAIRQASDQAHGRTGSHGSAALIRRCQEAGILVPAGSPRHSGQPYMFLHRTIAEYLTARFLGGLPPGERMVHVVAHQWFDPDWAEVIPLLGQILPAGPGPGTAAALVTHFLSQRHDPLHCAFHMAIRVAGNNPDPDSLLTPAQARDMAERVTALMLRQATQIRLIRSLSAIPRWPRPVSQALLRFLRDPSYDDGAWARDDAARELNAIPHWLQPVSQALLRFLRDPRNGYGAPSAAARALAGNHDPAVTQALLSLIHSYPRERSAAVDALTGHHDPSVTQALLPLLRDPNANMRFAAAKVLAGHHDSAVAQAVTEALLALLSDQRAIHRGLRGDAALVLAGNRDPAVTEALLPLLGDPLYRVTVAKALAGHLDPAVTRAVTRTLLALLRDPETSLRSDAAAEAVASSRDPAVAQALLPHLRDRDYGVRSAAAKALAGSHDPAVTQALLPLLRDRDHGVRSAAAKLLADNHDPALAEALLPLLRDRDKELRCTAAVALADSHDPAVTQAVAEDVLPLLRDPNRELRCTAALALAGSHDPTVTQAVTQAMLPLLRLRRFRDWQLRHDATMALAGNHDTAATRAVLHRLRREPHFYLMDYSAALAAVTEQSSPLLLEWVARQRVPLLGRYLSTYRFPLTGDLFTIADQIAERDYLRLEPGRRPRVVRRLGYLTRKAAPVPGQRRRWGARLPLALTRQGNGRLRRRPASAAAAFAAAAIAGVLGGTLTGYITLGLWSATAAFTAILVIGMAMTYIGERAEDNHHPETPASGKDKPR